MPRQITPETIHLFGGRLCLDFANSVDWSELRRPVAPELDALRHPQWLARWGRRLGLGPDWPSPAVHERELRATHDLRPAVHAIFSSVASGEAPDPAALETLDREYARAAAHAHLAPRDDGWRLTLDPGDPRLVRFTVALDAVALLTDPDSLARVRRCPGRDCGWLFLDVSGKRRWCSMRTCGSREKMRRLRGG